MSTANFISWDLITLLHMQLAVMFEWIMPVSRALLANILKFWVWFGWNGMNHFQYTP